MYCWPGDPHFSLSQSLQFWEVSHLPGLSQHLSAIRMAPSVTEYQLLKTCRSCRSFLLWVETKSVTLVVSDSLMDHGPEHFSSTSFGIPSCSTLAVPFLFLNPLPDFFPSFFSGGLWRESNCTCCLISEWNDVPSRLSFLPFWWCVCIFF